MATIRDVCKLAGVSVATVSRVINKKGNVSKEKEDAILNAIKMLNYTPNDVARRLAGKKSNTIGLIIPNILNPYFPEIARAAEDKANKVGYNIILCNTDNDKEKEHQYYEMLLNKQVDGIIISSYTATPDELLSVIDKGMPLVIVDNEYKNYNIPSVSGNNEEGGELAAKHLIECGCKNIAHITGPMYIDTVRYRFLGFEKVLKKYGLYNADLVRTDDFSLKGGYNATKKILEEGKIIDGIFAGNDIMAIGCYKALKDSGYDSFEKIRLIGYDGLESNINYLEISSIAQHMYEIGESSVELLIRKIENKEDISCEKIKINPTIVKRYSTILRK